MRKPPDLTKAEGVRDCCRDPANLELLVAASDGVMDVYRCRISGNIHRVKRVRPMAINVGYGG